MMEPPRNLQSQAAAGVGLSVWEALQADNKDILAESPDTKLRK
jgi:hypothetical protein